jgi:MFS family permease
VVWQGGCSALVALGAWTHIIITTSVLACVFALGIGIAFGAPIWGAIAPDIVSKEELPSAVTLGGVQANISGIVGPVLGGLVLPLLGAPFLISINASMFLVVALVVLQWKPRQMKATRLRKNFGESFINSLRYALNSPRMKTILFRNLLFSLVISVVPALLPVIALKELHLSPAQLGLIVTCVGIGSLAGAMIALPYLQCTSPNAITSTAMAIMAVVLPTMAFIRQPPALMLCASLAGVAWALAGSELWLG